MEEFSNYHLEKLTERFREEADRIILLKLIEASEMAIEIGEFKLHEIIRDLDLRNINEAKHELENHGYSIEMDYPKIDYSNLETDFTNDKAVFKASLKTDELKLKIRKTLFEV